MEFPVEIPQEVIARARKYNSNLVKAHGAPIDFRMVSLSLDPREGHFLLKNNHTKSEISLRWTHSGSCAKTARVFEAQNRKGLMVQIESECSCEPESVEKVVEKKIGFAMHWQTRPYCNVLIDHLEEEGFKQLMSVFQKRFEKPVGGDEQAIETTRRTSTTSD